MSINSLINLFYGTLEEESYESPSIMANDNYDLIINNKSSLASGNTQEFRGLLESLPLKDLPRTEKLFVLIEEYFKSG